MSTDDPPLYIRDVLHAATVEVTEEGTVASAATAVVMATRAMPAPPPKMTLDRPFLFSIVALDHDEGTGKMVAMRPLFVGRVTDPELLGMPEVEQDEL